MNLTKELAYPFENFNSFENFEHPKKIQKVAKEPFYWKLNGSSKDKKFKRRLKLLNKLINKTSKDLTMLDMKSDTLNLADIIETFNEKLGMTLD